MFNSRIDQRIYIRDIKKTYLNQLKQPRSTVIPVLKNITEFSQSAHHPKSTLAQ